MRVTGIDILALHYDRTETCHEGLVTMEVSAPAAGTAPMWVQYLCHSAQREAAPASVVTHDLIRDALRQARRMPGFRRGEQRIEMAASTARIERRVSA